MGSNEIITGITIALRPWLLLGEITPEVIYENAREIVYGSSGGASVS